MLRKQIVLLLLILTIAGAGTPGRAHSPDALKFFKNYFGNIDYVTGGVSLLGTGVNGTTPPTPIPMGGVPANADILAAFLYWETVITKNKGSATAGATFRGYDISTIAFELNPAGTAPCWSSGGGVGNARGAHRMKAFRADVLRFLPVPTDESGNPIGKRLVNDTDLINKGFDLHTVTLPDSGRGHQVPATTGASLVVVYRDPNAAGPSRSIVIYNGGYTMDQRTHRMMQTIQGFYQASTTSPVAKMTQIVGNGQPNFKERLMFGDNLQSLQQLDSLNPFQSAWENKTFENLPLSGGASSATVLVDHERFTPFDCLSWGVIIFSTTVQDTDVDGLLDIWESSPETLYDPNNQPLPNLNAMGANPNVKDIFIEIGYMKTTEPYTNPAQGLVDVHDHLPAELAVTMVGNAFKNAPVKNPHKACGLPSQLPCGPTGIKVHFDVGNNYQANPYVIPWSPGPSSLARGGEFIDEMDTRCDPAASTCLFPDYPGTVGWKTGFWQYRDQPLTHGNEADCLAAGVHCVRRFDRARKDIFHYALFAHALGVPRAPLDDPSTPGIDETVTPRTNTGIADAPGGDILMTFGFFDEHVGTPFIQATSLMHELGHNLGLRHGGIPLQPNCKPNYQSVMNYLFQVRGLIVGTANVPVTGYQVGVPVIDYSRQALGPLNESNLSEPVGLGAGWLYRTRWYAPLSSSFLDQSLQTTPAAKHCDGSPITDAAEMVRVDGTTIAAPPGLDWNADGFTDSAIPAQDVSFNGTITSLDRGVNDWAIVDLRQLGTRRNVSSPGNIEGALSLDLGQGEWGQGEWGQGEWGQGEWGQGEWGDLGQGEWGQGEWGQGEWGAGRVDLDFETATALGSAPNELTLTSLKHGVRAKWKKPHVGNVKAYEVYRVTGSGVNINSINTKLLVGVVSAPATTVIDTTAKKHVTYSYFVIAIFDDHTRSGVSNVATITCQ